MTLPSVPSNSLELRSLFAAVPQSVVALCGLDDTGIPRGLTASSFTPISLDPPLVSVAMANTSTTWPVLRDIPQLGISLLSYSQGPVSRQLAAKSDSRFDEIEWNTGPGTTAVYIAAATAHLQCKIFDEIPAGDHNIVLLQIDAIDVDHSQEPLVFHSSSFRRLEKTA